MPSFLSAFSACLILSIHLALNAICMLQTMEFCLKPRNPPSSRFAYTTVYLIHYLIWKSQNIKYHVPRFLNSSLVLILP